MAAVLPEQLAVWSYPMRNGDRYEASFNMVNAMLGRIHQSGHLAELPAESFAQVLSGIAIYKKELRPKIARFVPFFPLGMPSMADEASPVALGMEHPEADYYAVWRLKDKDRVRIPLKNKGRAELLYPVDLNIGLVQEDGGLTLHFPKSHMAAIVKVKK
jgi:alpha-galactosidase